MGNSKSEVITFKVEPSLAQIIDRIPNKSEFIRTALLAAIENTCPLCQGAGVLTPKQREHWKQFTAHHQVETCGDCDAVHIHCEFESKEVHNRAAESL